MNVVYATSTPGLQLLLISPFLVLVASGLVLVVAAAGSAGAASEVSYPEYLPVYAGLLAAMPSVLFAVVAGAFVWRKASQKLRLQPGLGLLGLLPLGCMAVLLLVYANAVGDPEHYRGAFNMFTQQWDPRFEPQAYIALILGVAGLLPMGALAVLTKLLYIDAIQSAKFDKPQGTDPIGRILSGR